MLSLFLQLFQYQGLEIHFSVSSGGIYQEPFYGFSDQHIKHHRYLTAYDVVILGLWIPAGILVDEVEAFLI